MWRIRVPVTSESEDAVTSLMENILGTTASVYTDVDTGRSWVSAFLGHSMNWIETKRSELTRGLRSIADLGLAIPRIHVGVSRVAAQDWAESWKRHFKPLQIGRDLLILPSWSRRRLLKNQVVVVLDPGLSFGTGQHPTTRFCLEQLVKARRQNSSSLLDMGCGSGILAIAAAAVGYQRVEAFDFDPAAVNAGAQNAKRNRLPRAIKFGRRDLTRMAETANVRFDVVCANLTADLLMSQAKKIRNRLAEGGRLVVAGILQGQFQEVQQTFEKHRLALVRSQTNGEWRSGVFRFR